MQQMLCKEQMANAYLKKQTNLKQPNFLPQRTKERKPKTKVSRKKEITTVRTDKNETGTKKTIE